MPVNRPVEPLYALTDVEGLLPLFHPCRYGERFPITEGVDVRFTDIGHLLGSAAIELWLKEGGVERKIVFSGDVGNRNQPIIKDPQAVDGADYLVIESTYGDRLHEQRSQANSVAFLADVIQRTLDRGGNVVIPAFSVGRTQEMLYFIREIKAQGWYTVTRTSLYMWTVPWPMRPPPSFFSVKLTVWMKKPVRSWRPATIPLPFPACTPLYPPMNPRR